MAETAGRVLIALPQPAVAEELFELALRIASRRRLRLHALIREASELAAAGALPFIEEIDRCSGVRHPFDAAAAARAIARLAHECEHRLRERAAALRVECGLEAVHGPLVGQALAALAREDVLLLGSRAVAWARPGPRAPRRIGVVRDGIVDEDAARAIAADLIDNGHASASSQTVATLPPHVLAPEEESLSGVDILVVSRHRAVEHGAALQRFLIAPQRLVVVLP
ncbi:MAG TPA: hypothetical protein PJ986_15150 [Gammaproteobacteria bacterium]|nr:hypothetical protein [Gammaproteobacteria bacterium]